LQSAKFKKLVTLFSRLPGVGEKTAQRYVLYLLTADAAIARDLGSELVTLHEQLRPCVRCGNIAEVAAEGGESESDAVCVICRDTRRDPHVLCVVARVHDLYAIERTGAHRGRYFVLGRLLSPLEGIGPEDLPLPRLLQRIREDGVTEVIVATPPSVDGEATALLLKRELGHVRRGEQDASVTMTRIASGIPHGGDLEYADPITMGRALAGRQAL
jgi:recombination protein RecR